MIWDVFEHIPYISFFVKILNKSHFKETIFI